MDTHSTFLENTVDNSDNNNQTSLLDIPKSTPENPYFGPSFDYDMDNNSIDSELKKPDLI